MIHIDRLPKPDILEKKETEWTEKFVPSDKKRPDSNKYRHPKILEQLEAMSFHKCFFCERSLKGLKSEVDHFVEVSDPAGRQLAYKWDNLYLSCDNCNEKLPNKTIPLTKVLDPCKHTDVEIEHHLRFEDEIIMAKHGSELGLKTIQKYKLGSERLDYLRLKQLSRFKDFLEQIRLLQLKQGRDSFSQEEKKALNTFAQKSHPFSLMFRNILLQRNLLSN